MQCPQTRWLHVYDTKALHSIYVKDQESYSRDARTMLCVYLMILIAYGMDQFANGVRLPRTNTLLFGPGLLSTSGHEHRRQRKLLNPAFSAAHMRGLTPMFYNIAGKVTRPGMSYL